MTLLEPEKPAAALRDPENGKSPKGSARQVFGESVNAAVTRERIDELIEKAFSLTGLIYAYCPKCRQKLQVEVPDVGKTVQALKELLEQAEGRPAGEEATGVTLIVERPAYREVLKP